MGRNPPPSLAPPTAPPHEKPCENCVQGDYYSCPCPHCGKVNRYIVKDFGPLRRNEPYGFAFTCPHCQKEAWYWAWLKIVITSDRPYRPKTDRPATPRRPSPVDGPTLYADDEKAA